METPAPTTTVLHPGQLPSLTKRSVAVQVSNKSKYTWESPRVYFRAGTADNGVPGKVETGDNLVFGARGTRGPVPAGSVGVVTYYVPSQNVTVALLWSVPFNYLFFSNMWNVGILKGDQPASAFVYDKLVTASAAPHQGDANFYTGTGDQDWNYQGSMGHSASPCLEVSVFCM